MSCVAHEVETLASKIPNPIFLEQRKVRSQCLVTELISGKSSTTKEMGIASKLLNRIDVY